jgi:NIMA (never in mitosis gene a)-related kinase
VWAAGTGPAHADGAMDAFEREKKIGQGAFGCALLIKRKKDGKRMVAKEINVAGMPEKDQLSAMQEVNVMQALKHENIITLHKSFLESGNLYIVMEYAEGGDLAGFLKRSKQAGQPLSEEKVLQTVGEILSGLAHVHANKFVHRDIKPANVLLSKNGVAKLADFGVSRVLSYTMEEARTMIGTPYYLAPEMIEDKGYSYPADIWSAGVLMYEMLTYTHPFQGAHELSNMSEGAERSNISTRGRCQPPRAYPKHHEGQAEAASQVLLGRHAEGAQQDAVLRPRRAPHSRRLSGTRNILQEGKDGGEGCERPTRGGAGAQARFR